MARQKIEIQCPYCDKVCNANGYTSHCRSKHPEHYEEYMKNKPAFIAKHQVGAEPTAPEPEAKPPTAPPTPTEQPPEEPKAAPVEKQKTGGFLDGIAKALRDL